MATAAGLELEGDRWVTIPATWAAYRALDRSRGERSNPRLVYNRGRLTIVSPGVPHEVWKSDLVRLVELMLLELGVRRLATGAVTLRRGGPKAGVRSKGVEADASFYFSHIEKVRAKRSLSMKTDPAPDLVIEVVVSHDVRDSLAVYAEFGVREAWVLRGSGLTFLALGPDRRYAETATSVVLPFVTSEELWSWLTRGDASDDVQTLRAFRDWVVTTLAPRRAAAGGGAADGT